MNAREIRQMTNDEIERRIRDEELALSNMKFQLSLSQLTNSSKIAQVRKDIARMHTVLRERATNNEGK